MAFTRTKSGLSNLAQFHGADVILFTEGGVQSFTFEDVCNGRFNEAAIDIKFWSAILAKHGYDKRVRFRALGSKSASKKICELIVSGQVRNVVVARDSDLDDFLSQKYNSPFILYTRGYSWENDVYEKELVKEQVNSLLMEAELKAEYVQMIDDCFEKFMLKVKNLMKLELIFRTQGKKFITDSNGERFIDGKNLPLLKMSQIRDILDRLKSELNRPVMLNGMKSSFCPVTYCYGKLFEALAISLVSYIVSNLEGRKSAQPEAVKMAMIERYKNTPSAISDGYYNQLVATLKAG